MSKWKRTVLGDVATIITGPFGSQLHQSDYVPEGIAIVMPQNIDNRKINYDSINFISEADAQKLIRYKTQKNDILYARRGNVEKHAFITEEESGVYCGTGCLRVRVTAEEIEPLFLSFFLNGEETKRWIVTHAVGSNMPNLNTDILANIPISYPLLNEQREIVGILSLLDEKIYLNNKINDNLAA
ncbi:MAG: restriction endonuclease subunit S [Roseburia sp.]|nr:restriction endonuclease subunit S [Roseburia sp.]